jgi:hypothetical protein
MTIGSIPARLVRSLKVRRKDEVDGGVAAAHSDTQEDRDACLSVARLLDEATGGARLDWRGKELCTVDACARRIKRNPAPLGASARCCP